jgi:hypothetical protein
MSVFNPFDEEIGNATLQYKKRYYTQDISIPVPQAYGNGLLPIHLIKEGEREPTLIIDGISAPIDIKTSYEYDVLKVDPTLAESQEVQFIPRNATTCEIELTFGVNATWIDLLQEHSHASFVLAFANQALIPQLLGYILKYTTSINNSYDYQSRFAFPAQCTITFVGITNEKIKEMQQELEENTKQVQEIKRRISRRFTF